MEHYLADRTSLIDASGIRKVFALGAKLKDPINFSIGQPDFDVPEPAKKAAIEAIEHGYNKYSQTMGDSELFDKIKASVVENFGWENPPLLVVSGVSGALLLAFMATLNPGDEVIVPDPYFVIYKHVVNLLGGKCVYVDTYPDFHPDPAKIEAAITSRTKMLVLNSPANPTGAVYSEQDVKELARIARKHDLLVMSDEIYDKFTYDGPCPSIASHYDKTLLVKGFSKTYAMTGWRLGYATGSKEIAPLIEAMTKIQQYTFVCAPTPFQRGAIAAMEYDMSSHIQDYKAKRDLLYDGLKDNYEITKPQGAFYAFIKAPDWAKNSTEFVEKAIQNNVLIIPGCVFSEKDTHFRLCFTTTNDKIAQGVEILTRLAKG